MSTTTRISKTELKIRIFVSSVQKELEPERLAITSLITTDPFLLEHCDPVLFDKEPISGKKASKPYLDCLDTCAVYLLLINKEYGRLQGDLSATHHEYRHAQTRKMPTLVFVKGSEDGIREEKTREFFEEIKKDGYTYKRFVDRYDLRAEIRASLIKLLKDEYGLFPSEDVARSGEETLEAASPFESQPTDATMEELDTEVALDWLQKTGAISDARISRDEIARHLHARGMVGFDRVSKKIFIHAAGIVFLGKSPSIRFPQCKVLLDAYKGNLIDPQPLDQETLSVPAPAVIERVLEFVKKNTRHPPVIKGIRRVILDEYPEKAVREAIVNGLAHRNYEDGSRHIMVEVFHDRIEISSPGYPPKPLTIAKLLKGKYRPCSRNPVIAQSLALLGLMEQRGSGMARMRAAMLDHGLDTPLIEMHDGYFKVTLPGPADDLKRIRVPANAGDGVVPPSLEEKLTDRQKKIVQQVLKEGFITTGWCRDNLHVVYDTAQRDLAELVRIDILVRTGSGRSTRFIQKKREE
jgi:predicted HTH transcriptional regulator